MRSSHWRRCAGLTTDSRPRRRERRHAIADAALKEHWDRQRRGPAQLSHRDAVALAGKLYAELLERPNRRELIKLNLLADEAGLIDEKVNYFEGRPPPTDFLEDTMFGWHMNRLLEKEGLIIDDLSRKLLIREVYVAMRHASDTRTRQFREITDRTP